MVKTSRRSPPDLNCRPGCGKQFLDLMLISSERTRWGHLGLGIFYGYVLGGWVSMKLCISYMEKLDLHCADLSR